MAIPRWSLPANGRVVGATASVRRHHPPPAAHRRALAILGIYNLHLRINVIVTAYLAKQSRIHGIVQDKFFINHNLSNIEAVNYIV
jgi:hypothetical protein